jgi:hypothetical protein
MVQTGVAPPSMACCRHALVRRLDCSSMGQSFCRAVFNLSLVDCIPHTSAGRDVLPWSLLRVGIQLLRFVWLALPYPRMRGVVASSHAVGKLSGALIARRSIKACGGRCRSVPCEVHPSRKPWPVKTCHGSLRTASVVPWLLRFARHTVPGPRMLGVVASSHSIGWYLVGGLTRLAAARSVLARMI